MSGWKLAGLLASVGLWGCGEANALSGSVEELFSLEVSRVEVLRNVEALQVSYYRNNGLDVDLVRKRWLKLPVGAVTGWRGYALFTAAALRQMGLRPETLAAHKQVVAVGATAGPSGAVVTYSVDLRARFEQQLRARRAYVGVDEADAVVVQDLPAQPAVVWGQGVRRASPDTATSPPSRDPVARGDLAAVRAVRWTREAEGAASRCA